MFKQISKTEYKNLLQQVQFKTYFHETEFHEFLEEEFRWLSFEYYSYSNEAIIAFGRIKTCLPVGRLISLPFCEYGGLLQLKTDFDLEEFKREALKEFGNNIKIKFHPQILRTSNPELITHNFEHRTSNLSTHWLENLKSEHEIWDSFRKTLRHEIAHAQDQGLVIRKCGNSKELKKFYNLYVANLRRKKTIPYPWRVVQFLCQNPSSELLLAFHRDKIIGGSLFVEYSGFVHYFLSASDYKYKNLGANYLILWEKIKSLIGQNKILDLGATPKNSSLYTFKSGWGGKEYPIVVLENKKNPESLRSSRLRNLFALLPNFAVKILSSRLIKYRL